MLDTCRNLDADVRCDPEYRHLTVLSWEDKGDYHARLVQEQIQRQTAQYPGLKCFCFDPFSTLVYAACAGLQRGYGVKAPYAFLLSIQKWRLTS